jgi:hypothetical protein
MEIYSPKKSVSFWKKPVPFFEAIGLLIILSIILITTVLIIASNISSDIPIFQIPPREKHRSYSPDEKWKFQPKPLSLEKMKTQGCVTDGFLSSYGKTYADDLASLIKRSNCYYLHRALETWLVPPDFYFAAEMMQKIDRPNIVYGMFIAEALNEKAKYYNEDEERYFDFNKMCRKSSTGAWGFRTCKPSFEREEYRSYLRYITRKAMDLGIQSFLFGQIFIQESSDSKNPIAPEIVKEMRDYAKEKDLQVFIGAQTNSITNEEYLKIFDYIEGGVGIDSEGNIEDGPCLSKRGGCWALLWHENFSSKANNVFLHLDWSGIKSDDMSIFARMNQETRNKTLENLYQFFTEKNMAFLMPYFAVLDKTNNGCYGPKKSFYSPDMKYSCQDENEINAILKPKP